MKLSKILDKFTSHIKYGNKAAIFYDGEFIGHVHQDKTRCIYEAVLREGKVNMKFLSQFKYRRLLRIKNMWGSKLYLYVLQEIRDDQINL